MKKVLVLHGPNLNRLGEREPERYGSITLHELNLQLQAQAESANIRLSTEQSQSEAALIETIHCAKDEGINYLIVNFAAFTHTSIALRDALLSVKIPFIEVHISNIYGRESFRHQSYFSDIAQGIICGLGTYGYVLALEAIINVLTE